MSDQISNEELTAYLDGEISVSEKERLERAFAADVQLQQRLAALSINKDKIRSAFQSIDPQSQFAAPTHIQEPWWQFSTQSFAKMAAGILLGLLVGAGLMNYYSSSDNRDWRDFVASYQALYGAETLASINSNSSTLNVELSKASAALGKTIKLADVGSDQNLNYKRAQILSFKGETLVQLAFVNQTGVPFALCIIKSADQVASQMQISNLEGLASASWSKDGYEYLLIGGQNKETVSQSAQEFQKRI